MIHLSRSLLLDPSVGSDGGDGGDGGGGVMVHHNCGNVVSEGSVHKFKQQWQSQSMIAGEYNRRGRLPQKHKCKKLVPIRISTCMCVNSDHGLIGHSDTKSLCDGNFQWLLKSLRQFTPHYPPRPWYR